MDLKKNAAFQRAYDFKQHRKKIDEIKNSSKKSLDFHLPPIFLNKKQGKGYKKIFWNNKVNRENMILLEQIMKIKERKRSSFN